MGSAGARGGDDILAHPERMAQLWRMRPHVEGDPPLIPPAVRRRALP